VSPNVMQSITLAAQILISVIMLVLGAYLLIAGKTSLNKYRVKGVSVRIIGAVILLGSAFILFSGQRGFFHRYGLIVQLVLLLAGLLLLWFLAKKPSAAEPLPAETHTFQSGPDEPPYRLHLRLLKDGSGILIVNAATVLHLNPTAAEYAFHMMRGTAPEETARQIATRYRISRTEALKDYQDFRDRVQTMIHTPDLDPTTYLDFERVAPHSKELTAPLRLDCALTYRLPSGTRAEYAPTKRVDRELTTAEWQTIMDKAWAVGIPHITFTGGEPTLREDLLALIAHAEKVGQVAGLLTDGLKLANKEYLHSLLQTGLDHLLFILQPDNPASWEALQTILPEDLYTTVHLTVTPQNSQDSGNTLERLARLQVKSLSLGASEESLHETLHTLHNQAASLGLTLRWDLPVPYSAENPVSHETIEDEVPSGAGKAWLYVEPDGDVLPTQGQKDQILGNFLKDPWEKIYKS
jgi:organic radical activating enzyme